MNLGRHLNDPHEDRGILEYQRQDGGRRNAGVLALLARRRNCARASSSAAAMRRALSRAEYASNAFQSTACGW